MDENPEALRKGVTCLMILTPILYDRSEFWKQIDTGLGGEERGHLNYLKVLISLNSLISLLKNHPFGCMFTTVRPYALVLNTYLLNNSNI